MNIGLLSQIVKTVRRPGNVIRSLLFNRLRVLHASGVNRYAVLCRLYVMVMVQVFANFRLFFSFTAALFCALNSIVSFLSSNFLRGLESFVATLLQLIAVTCSAFLAEYLHSYDT